MRESDTKCGRREAGNKVLHRTGYPCERVSPGEGVGGGAFSRSSGAWPPADRKPETGPVKFPSLQDDGGVMWAGACCTITGGGYGPPAIARGEGGGDTEC